MMWSTRSLFLACLAFAPGALVFAVPSRASAQQAGDTAPMEVTTDTPEYCLYLVGRVHTLEHDSPTPPPLEVANLSVEGQRMCEHGQTRGGIMRLRRALMLMMREDGPSER